jgi:hypothetical protein
MKLTIFEPQRGDVAKPGIVLVIADVIFYEL